MTQVTNTIIQETNNIIQVTNYIIQVINNSTICKTVL